jgi:hypothetical protein
LDILWVGKKPETATAGDEIFDQRLITACVAEGATVDRFYPEGLSRVGQLLHCVVRGLPHDRARFATAHNHRALNQAARRHRVAVVSTEPFDELLLHVPVPAIPILHNMTSLALPSILPRNLLTAFAARRARHWEERVYRSGRFGAVAVLSRRDEAYLRGLAAGAAVLFTPPGMPPLAPLAQDAKLKEELWLCGSYDWFPKRRDVIAFARAYAAVSDRLPIVADGLPPQAEAVLLPRAMAHEPVGSAIRFGLITDSFVAGHKLKTGYYLANNAVVLSFADVVDDFADIPDHDFFIRRIWHVREITRHIAVVSAEEPGRLRARLETFKQRCAETFSWQRAARSLLGVASRLAETPRPDQSEGP